MTICRLVGLVVCGALLAAACGGDDDGAGGGSTLVGAACRDNSDCRERCVNDGDYPGGMCTVSCVNDGNCPSGTACIDDKGGICAVMCQVHADCGNFGPAWVCDSKDRLGADGSVAVCRGN